MLKRIPKIAKITALIYFLFSSCIFIFVGVNVVIWGGIKEETMPLAVFFMTMLLVLLDYPFAWLMENWSAINSLPPFVIAVLFVLSGTVMWFAIGLLLSKVIDRFRKPKPTVLEERKTS